MIEKNYIILAHNSPSQLHRLISRLDDGYSYFFIHLDEKVNIDDFKFLKSHDKTFFVEKRENCIWGDFTLVQATLNCMNQIINAKKQHYTILLSESCYPITTNTAINNYLQANMDFDHIDSLPIEKVWKDWQDRIYKYKVNLSHDRNDYLLYPYFFQNSFKNNLKHLKETVILSYKRKCMPLLAKYLKTFTKRNSGIIHHYGGSAWWALTFDTLNKIVEFINNNKKFVRFHEDTLLPDEIFFSTIVKHLSSINSNIRIKPSLTYVNWSEKYNPVIFNENNLQELLEQRNNCKLFARKFKPGYSEKILELVDKDVAETSFVHSAS